MFHHRELIPFSSAQVLLRVTATVFVLLQLNCAVARDVANTPFFFFFFKGRVCAPSVWFLKQVLGSQSLVSTACGFVICLQPP